jgi:capsular polysaccharide export protein
MARAAGVAERVHFLGGALHMDIVLPACRSVVTVNSTLAIRALQFGRPVLALGGAIYDIPGLTWQGEADAFWREACPPDTRLAEAFIRGVAACLQVRGVGFAQPGLDAAVRNAVRRLHLNVLNEPLAEVLV